MDAPASRTVLRRRCSATHWHHVTQRGQRADKGTELADVPPQSLPRCLRVAASVSASLPRIRPPPQRGRRAVALTHILCAELSSRRPATRYPSGGPMTTARPSCSDPRVRNLKSTVVHVTPRWTRRQHRHRSDHLSTDQNDWRCRRDGQGLQARRVLRDSGTSLLITPTHHDTYMAHEGPAKRREKHHRYHREQGNGDSTALLDGHSTEKWSESAWCRCCCRGRCDAVPRFAFYILF